MNRRTLLKNTALASMGLIASQTAFAQTTEETEPIVCPEPVEPKFVMEVGISRNHGHTMDTFELEPLILLLRDINKNGPTIINIQGRSGHPHTVELNQESLVQILAEGEASIVSSEDAGHTHAVTLKLIEIIEEPVEEEEE